MLTCIRSYVKSQVNFPFTFLLHLASLSLPFSFFLVFGCSHFPFLFQLPHSYSSTTVCCLRLSPSHSHHFPSPFYFWNIVVGFVLLKCCSLFDVSIFFFVTYLSSTLSMLLQIRKLAIVNKVGIRTEKLKLLEDCIKVWSWFWCTIFYIRVLFLTMFVHAYTLCFLPAFFLCLWKCLSWF